MSDMNFQEKVTSYTGTFADTAALTQWLTQGAKHITDLLSEDKVKLYSVAVSVGAGLDISTYRPSYVHVGGFEARLIEAGQKSLAQDSNSIHYAISRSPIYYIEGNLYTWPSNGTFVGMLYPTVLYSESTILKFPSELEDAVVLYTSIRVLHSQNKTLSLSIVALPPLSYTNLDNALTAAGAIPGLDFTVFESTLSGLTPITSFTDFDTAMTDEDIELAQSFLSKIEKQLSAYSEGLNLAKSYLDENQLKLSEHMDKFKIVEDYLNEMQLRVSEYSQSLQRIIQQIETNFKTIAGLQDLYKEELTKV